MMQRKRFSAPVLYFAYGANMNAGQMKARCPGAKAIAVAKLAQHRLCFFGHRKRWDGAEETVLPDTNSCVWGVVYEVSHSGLDRLDAWQGVRLDGSGRYFHSPATVEGTDGTAYQVLIYRKDVLQQAQPPSAEYLDFILDGAVGHHLPSGYIDGLKATPAQPAHYPVPCAEDADHLLLGAGCHC